MLQRIILALLLIGGVMTARPASAQGGVAVRGVFSINPGARSIGLGGAFAAVADDATAAFANPAGLVQIGRPEISGELRGTLSSINESAPFYSAPEVSGLGFFSFVYPAQNWAVALYSHQLAIVDFAVTAPVTFPREFTVTSYAASGAYRFTEDLSLGLGLAYFNGDRKTGGAGTISDTDWGINAGLLWRPSRSWSLGGFYRQGPEFGVDDPPIGASLISSPKTGAASTLSFPTVFGVGAAFQPGRGAWTFAFEWDRVGEATEPDVDGVTVFGAGEDFHVGVEFAVLNWRPVVAIRVGIWRESSRNREIFTGAIRTTQVRTGQLTHRALGFGLAYKRFQFDLGFDLSDRPNVVSLSAVYSF